MNVRIKPDFPIGAVSNYTLNFLMDGGIGRDRLNVVGRYLGPLSLHRGSVDLTVRGDQDDDTVRAFWQTAPSQVDFGATADGGDGTDDGDFSPNIDASNFES